MLCVAVPSKSFKRNAHMKITYRRVKRRFNGSPLIYLSGATKAEAEHFLGPHWRRWVKPQFAYQLRPHRRP